MIELIRDRVDWLHVDDALLATVKGLPGTEVKMRGKPIIHRSLLPLIHLDEAENARALLTYGKARAWADRERLATDRGFKFRVTQQQALDFIEPRRGILVGDDMRLGKTLTALASHDPDRGQLLIVAPLSARAVWLGWIHRVFPDLEVGVCIGRKFDRETFDKPIVFCHYDIIHAWQSLRPIGTLVFDEAHALTNRKTKRTNAAVVLQCSALKVLALTGTPIWNMPPDLWSVINLVAPGAWGSYYDFANRYGAPVQTGYGAKYTGASNTTELDARMSEVMIRRLWKDCAKDLPPISRTVLVADINDAERRKLDILSASIQAERTNTAANLAAYRRQVAGYKIGVAYKKASEVLDRGEPVVVWTYHKDVAARLHELLGPERSLMIHGDIAPAERDRRIDAWKSHPKPAALIATMSVGQVAIDLSHAAIAIYAEIDYTPAIIGQSEMRTFDASRPMSIFFVVMNHIVDQRMVRVLINKLGAADSLGVGAANDAIDALRDAMMGPRDSGDLDRLLEDFIASMA